MEPPRERTKEEEELERKARALVKSSEDRRTVFIEAGDERLQFERMPTLELAKAQMAAPEKGGATDA